MRALAGAGLHTNSALRLVWGLAVPLVVLVGAISSAAGWSRSGLAAWSG